MPDPFNSSTLYRPLTSISTLSSSETDLKSFSYNEFVAGNSDDYAIGIRYIHILGQPHTVFIHRVPMLADLLQTVQRRTY